MVVGDNVAFVADDCTGAFGAPSLVATSMDTTESDTSFATALQSAASPDLAFAEPDPDVLDFTLVSELEVGTVTHHW